MARRKIRLRRNAKGRFMKAGASPRKRRTGRKRIYSAPRRIRRRRGGAVIRRRRGVAVAIANPRRRGMRRYRRNPKIFGINLGFNKATLKTVGFTVVGIAGTPFIEGFLNNMIVSKIGLTDPTMNKVLGYGVKLGSAYGVSLGVKQVAGQEAGRAALVGGLAYVAVAAIRDFFPQLLGTGSASAVGKYIGNQPLIGRYSRMGSPITAFTPDRLNPAARF